MGGRDHNLLRRWANAQRGMTFHRLVFWLHLRAEGTVRVGFGRDDGVFVNPYTGELLGPGSKVHDAMHAIEDWHRWLGSRDVGRPVTGACNLAFLGLALTGIYRHGAG